MMAEIIIMKDGEILTKLYAEDVVVLDITSVVKETVWGK